MQESDIDWPIRVFSVRETYGIRLNEISYRQYKVRILMKDVSENRKPERIYRGDDDSVKSVNLYVRSRR